MKHELDEEAVCIHCGFDGAEHWWLYYHVARGELGDDEWRCRKESGAYDEPPCNRAEPKPNS